jgi:hypothetical protein
MFEYCIEAPICSNFWISRKLLMREIIGKLKNCMKCYGRKILVVERKKERAVVLGEYITHELITFK